MSAHLPPWHEINQPCGYCLAKPGEPCRSRTSGIGETNFHVRRIHTADRKYREAHAVVPAEVIAREIVAFAL